MTTTATKFESVTTTVKDTPRRNKQIYNRTKYRLNKRRNLWLRSIGAAKNQQKIDILTAKVEAIDFALATLEEA